MYPSLIVHFDWFGRSLVVADHFSTDCDIALVTEGHPSVSLSVEPYPPTHPGFNYYHVLCSLERTEYTLHASPFGI